MTTLIDDVYKDVVLDELVDEYDRVERELLDLSDDPSCEEYARCYYRIDELLLKINNVLLGEDQ